MDTRTQAAARRDTGIEGHMGAGIAEQPLLLAHHAAAMRADQPVIQEADVGEINDLPWGRFLFLKDPDGNDWAIQEIQRPS